MVSVENVAGGMKKGQISNQPRKNRDENRDRQTGKSTT